MAAVFDKAAAGGGYAAVDTSANTPYANAKKTPSQTWKPSTSDGVRWDDTIPHELKKRLLCTSNLPTVQETRRMRWNLHLHTIKETTCVRCNLDFIHGRTKQPCAIQFWIYKKNCGGTLPVVGSTSAGANPSSAPPGGGCKEHVTWRRKILLLPRFRSPGPSPPEAALPRSRGWGRA